MAARAGDTVLAPLSTVAELRTALPAAGTVLALEELPIQKPLSESVAVWANRWALTDLGGRGTIRHLLSWEGVSLWYYLRIPLHADLNRAVEAVDRLQVASERGLPAGLVVIGGALCERLAVEAFAKARGLSLELLDQPADANQKPGDSGWRFALRWIAYRLIQKPLYLALRTLLGGGDRAYRRASQRILVFSGGLWNKVFDPAVHRFVPGNKYVHSLMKDLGHEFTMLDTGSYPGSIRETLRRTWEALSDKQPYRSLDTMFSVVDLLRAWRANKQVSRVWTGLREAVLASHPLYKGADLGPVLVQAFDAALPRYALPFLGYLLLARKILRQDRPSGMILVRQLDVWGRAFIPACREAGIPVFEIPHGIMPGGHVYMSIVNNAEDIADPASNEVARFPYPDLTFATGELFRKTMIEELRLPASTVTITGDPRWDEVHWFDNWPGFDRDTFLKQYGLPAERLVVVATQPLPDKAERNEMLRVALEACAAVPGCHAAIKLHPQEYAGDYRQVLDSVPQGRFTVLPRNVNYLELLRASSAFVTGCSTLTIKALMFRCPSIFVDLQSRGYVRLFEAGDVIYSVASVPELVDRLREVLGWQEPPIEWEALRQKFLKANGAELAGQVTARTAEAIRKVISEREGNPAPRRPA
jgi:hypothetical protein